MTARRVVVAMPWRAPAKYATFTIASQRVDDAPVDQEVDVDRRVVLGDRGLAGDLDELLAQVHLDRPVDERDQEHEARSLDLVGAGAAEAEHDQPVVLVDDRGR